MREIRSVAGMIISTLAVITLAIAPTTEARQPNFVIILADDLGAKDVGCYGGSIATPHIDALAERGVRFATCYTTPICTASRVMMMTGRYGFRTGYHNFFDKPHSPKTGTPAGDMGRNEVTFADVLKQAGYRTGVFGHWALPSVNFKTAVHDCGFDEYTLWPARMSLPDDASVPARFRGESLNVARYWDPALVRDGRFVDAGPEDFGPAITASDLIAFMKRHRDNPFLAFYSTILPHIAPKPLAPYPNLPDPRQAGGKIPGSLATHIGYLDWQVGQIVDAIHELGLSDDTIILFTGDNGTEAQGKATATELGCRVPMIVAGPGIRKDVVESALVDHADVLPTLADLAGPRAKLPTDRPIDGVSFAHVLRGAKGDTRDWIFGYLVGQRVLRTRDFLLEGDGTIYATHGKADFRQYTRLDAAQARAVRERLEPLLARLPAPDGSRDEPAYRRHWQAYQRWLKAYLKSNKP